LNKDYNGCTKLKNQKKIKSILKKFITENFLPLSGLNVIKDSDSFMEKGVIDSTGVLELIAFVEDRFGIKVEDEEIIPDNLDSLASLTAYLDRKLKHSNK
jgi:acyl carrier protein